MDNMHPFEKALLGKAPFRCVRVEERTHNGRAGSSCDYCGTSIRWVFFIRSADFKEFKVGCDCVAKTPDKKLNSEVKKVQREYKAESKRQALRARAAVRAQEFLAAHPGLEQVLSADHEIIRDIAAKLFQYGSLSERQVAFVYTLAERVEIAKLEVYTCAAPPALDVPKVDGRIEVVAKVLSTRLDEARYGTTVLKALYEVRTPEGFWKAWGTLPSGIRGDVKGNIYTIRTRVERSKSDPKFGFFNRPVAVNVEG